ncbi:MAG: HAD family phosphatase [bacterium]|nr:HAD family phosphatase [bacterium]
MGELKINTFIFDCFGVICDPVLNGWYRDNRLKHGLIDNNLLKVFKDFDLGNLSEDDIVEYFSKYEGVNSTKEELRREIDGYVKLDNKLSNIILNLKNKGFKTALLSNANASFFERKIYTDYPGFKYLFNEIIISSEVGITKPDKEIYLYALKKINSKPGESLFIDDSKINVEGAEKVGMQGFLYTNSDSFAEYVKNLG